ncbi:MAG: transglycosylase SLT domain-containing protein, partial [Burkholderiaceae bacterium]|nr:transglycosylase SLT domain-containing protein [Burkholderiaceae bacterium]
GFSLPALDTPLVALKERFYLSKPEHLQRMMERSEPYLYYIVDEIEKRGMPTEIALLPFVESAMNPRALSSAKAAGLWQFIPSTGKTYNLSQNWWVDNRRDVVKSTQAALDYLQKIYEMHNNDWFLALASYNWGEGAVGRAVKRNQAKGLAAGYLDLKMPTETRHYVPKLIALKHLIQHADEIGLALPDFPDRPYFAVIEKTRPIDLKLAAKFAAMSVDEFVALNPAHNRPVISATKNNQIKLRADRVDDFLAAIERHSEENRIFATWQPHTLAANETLATVASRGGVSEPELRHANSLGARQHILPGTRILAPQKAVTDESPVENFVAPRVYEQVSKAPLYYKVRKRDTLASIARRYRISEATLASLNDLGKGIRSGMRLLVRRGGTQTMLTDENGKQRVVTSSSPAKAKIRIASKKRGGARVSTLISDQAPTSKKPGVETSAANTREFAAKIRPVSLHPKSGPERRSPTT